MPDNHGVQPFPLPPIKKTSKAVLPKKKKWNETIITKQMKIQKGWIRLKLMSCSSFFIKVMFKGSSMISIFCKVTTCLN